MLCGARSQPSPCAGRSPTTGRRTISARAVSPNVQFDTIELGKSGAAACPHGVASCLAFSLNKTTIERAGLMVPRMGIGAWSWGDRSGYWGYGGQHEKEEREWDPEHGCGCCMACLVTPGDACACQARPAPPRPRA